MLAPKGFTQHLSQDAYEQAHVTAQKKVGILRFQIPLILLIAAAFLGGVFNVYRGLDGSLSHIALGSGLLFASAALIALFVWLPRRVKTTARQAYQTYETLCDPTDVVFESDEMLLKGCALTRRVAYAKTRLCIETSARFVIVCDDDAIVILEKSCFEDDNTALFLRDVFARWYRKGS